MASRRARMYAGRVIAGSGAQEPLPGRGPRGNHGPRHLPNFANPGLHLGQQGGYTGLQGVLAALQGGLSAQQFNRLQQGHTGGNGWGGIGGMNGAMSGLSPYATHFLSSLMEKKAAEHQDISGLEGDALWRAQLMNNLADQNAAANPTYQLHSGVDAGFLQQLFGQGIGGHRAYARGYNAEGPIRRGDFTLPQREGGPQRMGRGYSNVGAQYRRRPFRPGGVVRRPLR